jgi:hypothetical protein
VLLRYRVTGQRNEVELALRPLLPFREADALTFENIALDPSTERGVARAAAIGHPLPAVRELPSIDPRVAGAPDAASRPIPCGYRQLEYPADLARGYDGREDQFSPGTLRIGSRAATEVFVAASIDGPVEDLASCGSARRRRAQKSLGVRADDGCVPAPRRSSSPTTSSSARRAAGRSVDRGLPLVRRVGEGRVRRAARSLSRAREVTARAASARGRARRSSTAASCRTPSARRARTASYGRPTRACGSRARCGCSRSRAGSEERSRERFLPALDEIARAYSGGTRSASGSRRRRPRRAGIARARTARGWTRRSRGGPVTPRDGVRGRDRGAVVLAARAPRAPRKAPRRGGAREGVGARKRRAGADVPRALLAARESAAVPRGQLEGRSRRPLDAPEHGDRRRRSNGAR